MAPLDWYLTLHCMYPLEGKVHYIVAALCEKTRTTTKYYQQLPQGQNKNYTNLHIAQYYIKKHTDATIC